MKVHIYNQYCTLAGQAVPDRVLEQHENPDEGGDWTLYKGTEEELVEEAERLATDAPKRGAGNDRFARRVARTLLEACLWRADQIDVLLYGPDDEDEDE
jgi:hypothetical protein